MRDLELLPTLLGQDWTSVFLQRYDGSVTIWPRTKVSDWLHILSDPSPEQLEEMMKVGKRVTWPKIHIIENRSKLEREIIRGRQSVRQPTSRDRTTQDNLLPRYLKASRDVSPSSGAVPKGGTPFPNDLPIESDAEASFEKGSPRFFKRQHRRSRAVSPSTDKHQDDGAQYGLRISAPDASPSHSPTHMRSRSRSPPPQSSSFFSRLHRSSLASIPASFGGFRKSDPSLQTPSRDDGAWSSDSSSSDYPLDDAEVRVRRPSLLLDPLEGVQGFKENYPALDDSLGDNLLDKDYGQQE